MRGPGRSATRTSDLVFVWPGVNRLTTASDARSLRICSWLTSRRRPAEGGRTTIKRAAITPASKIITNRWPLHIGRKDAGSNPTETPFPDLEAKRHELEALLTQLDEKTYAHDQAKQLDEILVWLQTISSRGTAKLPNDETISIPKGEGPAYLEWAVWRAFLAIDSLCNPPWQARRFQIDQDFLPVSCAPGGGPDMVFEFEDAIVVVEVTLTASSRQEAAEGEPVRRHVAQYAEEAGKPVFGLFIAPLFAAVEEQVAQFPVVFLLGDGGCGKSVLAGRFVCEEGARRLVASVAARDFDRHWLGETFNEWRSEHQADSLAVLPVSEVLRRVLLANEQQERPLIVVKVDGIDEATDEDRRELRRLLDTCRTQRPPSPYAMVLLLTARLSDPSLERTRDCLIRLLTSAHYPAALAPQFGVVSVRDFDDDELREAITALPDPLRDRLEEAIRILSGQVSATATLGEEASLQPTRPIADPGLLASLHHPALWGEFLDLGRDIQEQILDGQQGAVYEFAHRFLESSARS